MDRHSLCASELSDVIYAVHAYLANCYAANGKGSNLKYAFFEMA